MKQKTIFLVLVLLLLVVFGAVYGWTVQREDEGISKDTQHEDIQTEENKFEEPTGKNHEKTKQDDSKDTGIKNEQIDISDWKTYRNEEYGFEFKYPENWKKYVSSPQIVSCSLLSATLNNTETHISIVGSESGCFLNYSYAVTLFGDKCFFISFYSPEFDYDWQQCKALIGSIEDSRKNYTISSESAWLKESEIPKEAVKSYNIFRNIIDTFQMRKEG